MRNASLVLLLELRAELGVPIAERVRESEAKKRGHEGERQKQVAVVDDDLEHAQSIRGSLSVYKHKI